MKPAFLEQIEDDRLNEACASGGYLQAAREVLNQYRELWFMDESFAVVREA